jgi:hypothetical protein
VALTCGDSILSATEKQRNLEEELTTKGTKISKGGKGEEPQRLRRKPGKFQINYVVG